MNILEKIIAHKREELEVRKAMLSESEMEISKYFDCTCLSLRKNLLKKNATGIIAEFKRKSPSKGYINKRADVSTITKAYTEYGASGLSILTDHEFFGGSTEDIVNARENQLPILRKEFIIDPYQITAAKAMGADVILLIAACLTKSSVKRLAAYAKQLKMEVLLEVHEESELDHICEHIDMVGINNRNLKTFEVDINHSIKLAEQIPAEMIKIAESGISNVGTIRILKDAGFKGFLIGENFMKEKNPGEAFKLFVTELKNT